MLPIGHIDFAGIRIIIHRAKLPPTKQRPHNLPCTQVNSNDRAVAGGNISGKTTRDTDIFRSTGNRYRAEQVPVHFEDRECSTAGDPQLIGS